MAGGPHRLVAGVWLGAAFWRALVLDLWGLSIGQSVRTELQDTRGLLDATLDTAGAQAQGAVATRHASCSFVASGG